MSHAASSPVKKRRRLSLKVHKKAPVISSTQEKSDLSVWDVKQETNEDEKENKFEEKNFFQEGDSQSTPEELKPGVGIIGFENLGNTCFLNSVLQILRYTPGFLDGLEVLHKDVLEVEKLQHELNEESKKELGDDWEKTENNLSLRVAKILQQLFTRMDNREKKFRQLGSSAVASMTVKPDRLLETLRQINPMFEGYLQHDAQELLRCLLCYLQDAWKEINKVRRKYRDLELKRKKAKESSLNSITNYFGKPGSECLQKSTLKVNVCKSEVRTALFTDNLDSCCISQEKTASTKMDSETNPQCSKKTLLPVISGGTMGEENQTGSSYDETDSMSCQTPCSASPQCKTESAMSTSRKVSPSTPVTSSSCINDNGSGRRRTRRSNGTPSPICHNAPVTTPLTSKRGNKRKKTDSPVVSVKPQDKKNSAEKLKSPKDSVGVPNGLSVGGKYQPSVLSMLGKREVGCKRLGMRGAVVSKIHNGLEAPDTLQDKSSVLETASLIQVCPPDHKGDGPSVIPDPAFTVPEVMPPAVKPEGGSVPGRSPGKRCPGVLEHVSETNLKSAALQDIRQATVKLEKCDPVCNSPLKSVSANEAIKRLGVPGDKQKDFVEHLFQGMMMLRTRCMECECSRERQEVFQDVSVPLKKTAANEEEEQYDSEDEPEESSLSCLMAAFTDVERLCDDNKYFCENCFSYVEAERSLHYETLPDILTLHLKRFAASSGYFGNLTKINDHVATPEYLPCLRYKCPRPCHRQDHRYKLYGLIAHSGVSITSGHYMSYVRLLPEARAVQNFLVKRQKSKSKATSLHTTFQGKTTVKVEATRRESPSGQCATGCARGAAALPEDSGHAADLDPKASDEECQRSPESGASSGKDLCKQKTPWKSSPEESVVSYSSDEEFVNKWLECDDDFIQVLDEEDFERRLAPNSGYNATPYVLFYIKDNDSFYD